MAIKGVDKNERVGSGRREERDGRYCWVLSDRMMKHIYILNREHIKWVVTLDNIGGSIGQRFPFGLFSHSFYTKICMRDNLF